LKSDRYGIFSPTAGNFRRGCPAKARAIDVGVNYLDTAVQYGNGQSEKNLGRMLQNLKLPVL
jgi:aryl-alcohol dehydrogenase-like predicted oxidoreductase